MSAIVTIGIDLAKNVFAVHGVNATGQPALVRPSVPRAKLLELFASLPPCLIGMEACSGAHHWAREFQRFGHTVRLMAPKFVIPYRLSGKRGKNDAADAASAPPRSTASGACYLSWASCCRSRPPWCAAKPWPAWKICPAGPTP